MTRSTKLTVQAGAVMIAAAASAAWSVVAFVDGDHTTWLRTGIGAGCAAAIGLCLLARAHLAANREQGLRRRPRLGAGPTGAPATGTSATRCA